jgi:hypothetical protein
MSAQATAAHGLSSAFIPLHLPKRSLSRYMNSDQDISQQLLASLLLLQLPICSSLGSQSSLGQFLHNKTRTTLAWTLVFPPSVEAISFKI